MIYEAGFVLSWTPSEIRAASLAEILAAIAFLRTRQKAERGPAPMTRDELKGLVDKHCPGSWTI